ncbi:hypothetical protein ACR77J_07845 [Tissierella praeacuta]|uniref:hypothetical protein n=1 Tax=Tissierella praeacuta TaxID=43131 RepID=UPI003DA41031
MREDNILKKEMLKSNIDITDLKVGDTVVLKKNRYAQIISEGEYVNDIDYGEMYKNIKRFKYIDVDTHHILLLEKRRNEHEKEILKHKKEMYRLDLLIYLKKNSETLASEYDSDLYEEFRQSKNICKIEDVGTFYETSSGIKRMITAGYSTLFDRVNIPKQILLKIKEDYDKVNLATVSIDVLDFSQTLNR